MKPNRILKNAQIIWILAISGAVLTTASCQENKALSTPPEKVQAVPKDHALKNEITKMIRQETYSEKHLKTLLIGKTEKQMMQLILAEKECIQKMDGKEPDKKLVAMAMFKIQSLLSRIKIEESKKRQAETLKKISKELRDMAKEEKLLPQ